MFFQSGGADPAAVVGSAPNGLRQAGEDDGSGESCRAERRSAAGGEQVQVERPSDDLLMSVARRSLRLLRPTAGKLMPNRTNGPR